MKIINKRKTTNATAAKTDAKKLNVGEVWVYGTGKFPAADYHGLSCISSHSIKDLANQNLSDYYLWRKYVKRDIEQPDRKRVFDVGSAAHTLVLEPGLYATDVAVQPEDIKVRRGKKWDEFNELNKGKTVVTVEQDKQVRMLADAVKKNPFAKAVMQGCQNEVTGLTKLPCETILKGRIDSINFNYRYGLDLKTVEDIAPAEFAKSAARYRYDIQAYTYMKLFDLDEFLFVCATKADPYEVSVYTLNDEFMEKAESDFNFAVERWKKINSIVIPASFTNADNPMTVLAPPAWFKYL